MKNLKLLLVVGAIALSQSSLAQAGRISSGGTKYIPKNEQIRIGMDFSCKGDQGSLKTLRISDDGSKVEFYDFKTFCIFSGPKDSTNANYPDSQVLLGGCDSMPRGTFGIIVSNDLFPANMKLGNSGKVFAGETYVCSQ